MTIFLKTWSPTANNGVKDFTRVLPGILRVVTEEDGISIRYLTTVRCSTEKLEKEIGNELEEASK